MSTPTITRKHIKYGDPGIVFAAPIGTAFPTIASTSPGKFSHAWASPWRPLGAMEEGEGFTFSYEVDTDDVTIEDSLDPLDVVTTGRNVTVGFTLAERSPENISLSLNGAVIANGGTVGNTWKEIRPPALAAETYVMLGWQSLRDDEVMGFYRCRQVGNLELKRGKGSNKTVLGCEFRVLVPDAAVSTSPYVHYIADQA